MIQNPHKRIALNSIIIYFRLAIVTIVSLFTTRYVLLALGASDFGLYNVVGSVVMLISVLSTSMAETTTRYINIEMGKSDGNLNKIFNISLIIHIILALVFFIIIEFVGVFYVNNYLNIPISKISDALFVLHISNFVACIGLINVPYQGLLNAFEKFGVVALVDIINVFIKLIAVLILLDFKGDALRFYALSMSILTLVSFVSYRLICKRLYPSIIRKRVYKDFSLIKEIFYFNNYKTLGSVASIFSHQGANIAVNFFFGTIVNAAFAISRQIQGFVSLFISNLGTAAAPRITQMYAKGYVFEAVSLCSKIGRYSFLLAIVIFFSLYIHTDYVISIWLKDVPEHTSLYVRWTLGMILCYAGTTSLPSLILACGNLKWFTYTNSLLQMLILPGMFMCFALGCNAEYAIILQCAYYILSLIPTLLILRKVVHLNIYDYVKNTFIPPIIVTILLSLFLCLYFYTNFEIIFHPIFSILLIAFIGILLSFFVGLSKNERQKVYSVIEYIFYNKLHIRK